MSQYIEEFEKKQMVENDYPTVGVGDTVIVHKEISEGKKTRIQRFQRINY